MSSSIGLLPSFARSASFRFTALLTVSLIVLVVVAGLVARGAVIAALEARALGRTGDAAGELVDEYEREGYPGLLDSIAPRLRGLDRRLFYAVIDPDGAVVYGDEDVVRVLRQGVATESRDAITRETESGSASTSRWAASVRPFGTGRTLVVADNLGSVRDVDAVLNRTFLFVIALASMIGIAFGALASRFLIRQISTITGTAEAIIGGELSQRIPLAGSRDEFDRLRTALNRMLETMVGLLENVHQVSTDIAHDLRTPLSRLRNRLERAMNRAEPGTPLRQDVERAVEEIDTILSTFAALLRIAQIESGRARSNFRAFDLSDTVAGVGEALEPVAAENGQHLGVFVEPGLVIDGDRDLFNQMTINLVENALSHTPAGTAITLDARTEGEAIQVTVSDTGPGIAPSDLPFVFRRFYRAEQSRTTPGTGLGLSLAAAIAGLHGGEVTLQNGPVGLTARVTIPRRMPGMSDLGPNRSGDPEASARLRMLARTLGRPS